MFISRVILTQAHITVTPIAVTGAAFPGVASMVSVRGNDFDRDWFEPKRGGFVRKALGRADRRGPVEGPG